MEKDVIKLSSAQDKPVKRNRARKGLTLATETVEALETLIEKKETTCLSRGIDLVTAFHAKNGDSVPVQFSNPRLKQAFISRCISTGKSPSQVLETLASEWVQSI